jgi:hypothetical protein
MMDNRSALRGKGAVQASSTKKLPLSSRTRWRYAHDGDVTIRTMHDMSRDVSRQMALEDDQVLDWLQDSVHVDSRYARAGA